MAAGWCLLGVPGSGLCLLGVPGGGLVFTGGSWRWAHIYWGVPQSRYCEKHFPLPVSSTPNAESLKPLLVKAPPACGQESTVVSHSCVAGSPVPPVSCGTLVTFF